MSANLRKQLLERLKLADQVLDNSGSVPETDANPDPSSSSPQRSGSDVRGKNVPSAKPSTDLPQWQDFFTYTEIVKLPERSFSFNTYYTLPSTETIAAARTVPVFVFHHGAGSSGLTFAPLAKELCERLKGACAVFAFDARGHGNTSPTDSQVDSVDYGVDAFVQDFHVLFERFLTVHISPLPREKLSIVLVGHSLGGSICTNLFPQLSPTTQKQVIGVAMFDIVEEAAILALEKVNSFLASTPNTFNSMSDAIDWHVQHGLSKTRSSAAISVPALFHETSTGKVVRKTNLKTFQPFWHTWFRDLSQRFVALATSKLLILAGNDNLDRQLIIGQMQGKFQLVVFQRSGHFIQEDYPSKTAITLIDFWKRNDSKTMVIKTNWKQLDS